MQQGDKFVALEPTFHDAWVAQTEVLLNSYERFVGGSLLRRSGDAKDEAKRLFTAPFAVLSHGTEADPVLNYANAIALELWEMTPETLVKTPSRLTAEPMLHAARERLLDETRLRGHVSGYSGWRISATGRRFLIEDVTIWNLVGADGSPLGQAATFARWSEE